MHHIARLPEAPPAHRITSALATARLAEPLGKPSRFSDAGGRSISCWAVSVMCSWGFEFGLTSLRGAWRLGPYADRFDMVRPVEGEGLIR
jgi:hypothetical protein